MSVAPFEVNHQPLENGVSAIAISGELDLDTAPILEAELAAHAADADGRLMLDLTGCEFIDSTGVALVVRTWQRLDSQAENGGSGRVVVCCASDQVRRVLDVTGLGEAISLYEDRDSGLAGLLS